VSEETVVELRRGNYPNKSQVLAAIFGLTILPGTERIMEITQIYIDNYLMPRKLEGDARHLAFASLYQMKFLLCNHLANGNKKHHIQVINARLQLPVPEILTPLELFKETIL